MITLSKETSEAIRIELESIPLKYRKPFNSTHEGYAVLKEEVDELWDEIKHGEKRNAETHKYNIKKEAIQVAAMACRIIQELT
jgi:hypothetical protein